MQNLPKHIVLIPDGNRRWAKNRGLPSFFGHRQGAKTSEKIFKAALDLKIPCLTFWGSSLDNITKRTPQEVNFLFDIFERWFKKLIKIKQIHQQQVKINVLGRWQKFFPERVKEPIREAIKRTKNYKNHQLTFLMAYSGIDEMKEAIKKIVISILKTSGVYDIDNKLRTSDVQKFKINEKLIKANLWTKNLPPVDLVIRTGSERDNWSHLSAGLMMWDMANAQFYFSKNLFPDFSVAEFKKAIEYYSQTERRMGK